MNGRHPRRMYSRLLETGILLWYCSAQRVNPPPEFQGFVSPYVIATRLCIFHA